MGDGKRPDDIDIYALLAEVHGSSDEDLRDGRITRALNTLEATHREAARGLRDLHTQGLRRARGTGEDASAQRGLPAHEPQSAAASQGQPGAAAAVPPHSSGGQQGAQPAAEAKMPIAVQSGEGADVQMDHRTLTHIVRPNRGRR